MPPAGSERCLLAQAALFLTRGLEPKSDELFDSAPLQLSDEENSTERLHRLVYALATGEIESQGTLSLVGPSLGAYVPYGTLRMERALAFSQGRTDHILPS